MSDIEQLRVALCDAAQGDDVDALAAAAGRLTAALIAQGGGSDQWEELLAELDARRYEDVELAAIAVALRALRALPREGLSRRRALRYLLARLGITWVDLGPS